MLKKSLIPLFGVIAILASCKQEPAIVITDKGPDVTVLSYTEIAYMGTEIEFSASISDKNYELSNLQVQLRYDEDVVASTQIRTSEAGEYEGTLTVPINKTGLEGIAELAFIGQNVAQGTTEVIKEVEIKKPQYDKFYAVIGDDDKRLMESDGNCHYTLSSVLPAEFEVSFESGEIPSVGDKMVYGFEGKTLTLGSTGKMTVTQSFEGECLLDVNLLTMEFTYTSSSVISFSENEPEVVLNMAQDAVVIFSGVDDFTNDIDFFEQDGAKYKFRCVSGKYKMVADYNNKFIRVDPVNDDGTYISEYSAEEGVKAIYAIGSGISKGGVPAAAWNPEAGAWPLAQYEKDKYCISFLAGRDVVSGSYFHLYNCRGWTSTFAHTAFSSVELGTAFKMDTSSDPTSSGNIGTQTIEIGKGYRLLFDFTGGYDSGVVTIEDVEFPVVGETVTVFGQRAVSVGTGHYCVASASIAKGTQYTITGVEDPSSLWVDPDYVTDNKFSAMTGYYQIDVYTDKAYVAFRRLKSDGGAVADINTGAIWLMGWGVGTPSLTGSVLGDNEPGWTPAKAIPMAEIEEGVYQFSGYAGDESSTDIGDRFRYDYLGLVWYGEQGWNQGNKGVMKGTTNTIQYTQSAQEWLSNSQGSDWQTLAASVTLEDGAFYVLTIDLNTPNVEKVDFYKK